LLDIDLGAKARSSVVLDRIQGYDVVRADVLAVAEGYDCLFSDLDRSSHPIH
jgi:hypothetical protein